MLTRCFQIIGPTIFWLLSSMGAYAQNVPSDFDVRMEQARNACLSGKMTKSDTEGGLVVQLDAILKKFNIDIIFKNSSEQITGALEILDDNIRRLANADIISCYDKAGLFAYLRGDLGPIIVLMDGNKISYEGGFDSSGISNSNRIREVLRLSRPVPLFRELGIFANWDSWMDVTELGPDVVIIHWSAFEKNGYDAEKDQLSCFPMRGNRCSEKIGKLLSLISKSNPRPVKFIVYSRAPFVCGKEFRAGILRTIPRDNKMLRKDIYLFSVPNDNAGFKSDGVPFDLQQIVNHALGRESQFENSETPGRCRLTW